MKKNKNKFKDFWNKIKKPLMILSLIGNLLFIMFIIIGCVGSKPKTQQVKADGLAPSNPINYFDQNIYTLRNSKWQMKQTVDISPLLNEEEGSYQFGNYYIHYSIEDENIDEDMVYYGLQPTVNTRLNSTAIAFLRERDGVIQSPSVWYNKTSVQVVGVWNYSRIIHIYADKPSYDVSVPREDYENKTLIEWFFNNAELLDAPRSQFKFVEDFNYNAVEYITSSSFFVPKTWDNGSSYYYTLRYGFISGSGIFTNINLYFYQGNNKPYMENGEIKVNQDSSCAFYSYMEYYNSDTGDRVLVNVRRHGTLDGQEYISNGSVWVNPTYRDIFIFENRDGVDNLTKFNTSVGNYSGYYEYNGNDGSINIGLTPVFSLIKNAFTSIMPIFAIQILPNITIGLLVFLPLILTIIIVIIKLVKR